MEETRFKGLFRGKRIDNDEWVEGYLIQSREIYGKSDPHTFIVNHEHPQSCYGNDIYIEVIPETIGYFTWLYDRNNVRVFEGDIVKLPLSEKNCEVVYKNGSFIAEYNSNGLTINNSLFGSDFEVIGNIYDNHKLLREEKK